MSDTSEKKFPFTCPECYVSLKARVSQAGARLMCPSCSASIVVPAAPAAKSIAGQTDRTIDSSAAEASGGYEIHAEAPRSSPPPLPTTTSKTTTHKPTRNTSENRPPQSGNGGYDLHATQTAPPKKPDLITVTCPICATRATTNRKNLGKKIRCVECGTAVAIVEAPKSPEQLRKPQKIDEARVGEYGVRNAGQAGTTHEDVTIPFNCRLCESLMRGTLAEVGTEKTCDDCGTKTVVLPPKKAQAKAVVGAAADSDLEEYGVSAPNVATGDNVPVICSLCHSRLMARVDQVGTKIRCPDCGAETVATPPSPGEAGPVMGAMAEGSDPSASYNVNAPSTAASKPEPAPTQLILGCSMCGRRVGASTKLAGRDVACPDCGTLIHVPQPKQPAAPPPTPSAAKPTAQQPPKEIEKVVHIGVDCPRCGTRIHATDRQVGKKVPCPDCDTPITIPPPKADAPIEQVIRGAEEYSVTAPQEVVEQTPMAPGGLKKDQADDPDFDFLDDVDDPELKWRLQNRSDELAFLGHPGASSRWFAFCLGGFGVFVLLAASFMMFGMPSEWDPTALAWAASLLSLLLAGVACLAWAAMFSVNLLAIVEDTSAGNHIVRNWPEGDWLEQIGGAFYVLNAWMVSFVPVTILLQSSPPTRPAAEYLYTVGLWFTFPVALLSMLEVGSVFVPISGNIVSSLFRRPGAWAWFYFRSFGLIALGLAMYIAFWRHICGPIALPLLAPMSTSLAMVYARWLGILGQSVREVIEEDDEDAEEDD